jgi:hypothetical protein
MTKKQTIKRKTGLYINKKTRRNGGMFKAITGIFGANQLPQPLPPPPPGVGDKHEREYPDTDPNSKRNRKDDEDVCWICLMSFSEEDINKYGPRISCIGNIPHYAHKTCISQWCNSQKNLNDGLCRCGTCSALINLPENILNAFKIGNLKKDDDPNGKVPIIAQEILERMAINNGSPFATKFFKDKANDGDAHALNIIGKAAKKWADPLIFLYDKNRRLHPGEKIVSKKFILLAPYSDNQTSAISEFGFRRWPELYFPTEKEVIEWNIKMPRSWWEKDNGLNLPFGWYTKRMYNQAHHLIYRDKNAIIPKYNNGLLVNPGTILHDKDEYVNGLLLPVWVLENPTPSRDSYDYDTDTDTDSD